MSSIQNTENIKIVDAIPKIILNKSTRNMASLIVSLISHQFEGREMSVEDVIDMLNGCLCFEPTIYKMGEVEVSINELETVLTINDPEQVQAAMLHKEAQKAEKERKKAEDKAAKDAQKAQKAAEKAAEKAQREAERARKAAEKEAEKAAKEAQKAQKEAEKAAAQVATQVAEVQPEVPQVAAEVPHQEQPKKKIIKAVKKSQ